MFRSLTTAITLVVSSVATHGVAPSAEIQSPEPLQAGQGRPHGPPPEAIDACKDKSEGNACSVDFHGTTVDGTCRKGPDGNGPLACMPAHPPGPPPEAIESCINKSAGDACSVTFDDRTLDGTCRSLPNESDLACMPDAPPR